jgi:hypothetical protein
MKITRRKLRRLIRESIRSVEEESSLILPEMVEKLKALISTKDAANEAMAASLIESFYNDLYQLSIIEGDFISVAVRATKDNVLENPDLLDLMKNFNLEDDEKMPPAAIGDASEAADVKDEYRLQSPDHSRVYFKYEDEDDMSSDEDSESEDDVFYDPEAGDFY